MLAEYTSDDTGNWKHWPTQPAGYKQRKIILYWYFLKKLQFWAETGRKEAENLDSVFPTLWPGCQFLSLMNFRSVATF